MILTHKSPLVDSITSPGSKIGRSVASSIVPCHFTENFMFLYYDWSRDFKSSFWREFQMLFASLKRPFLTLALKVERSVLIYGSSMKYFKECLKPRMKLATTCASVRFESRPALTICRTVSEVSLESLPKNSFRSKAAWQVATRESRTNGGVCARFTINA